MLHIQLSYACPMGAVPQSPRPQRLTRLIAAASIAVAAIVVVAVFTGIERSQAPVVSRAHSYSRSPFPPLWTTTVPGDSAFGGVLTNLGYYTIVPLSSGANLNFYRIEVVAFSIQNGRILWNSTPISISGAGDISPQVVLGSTELYLVGYASSLDEPGAPWNGTQGVFAVGFNLTTGAAGSFTSRLNVAAMQVGEVESSGGMVYAGYIESGTAVLQAFPLPESGHGTPPSWRYDLQLPTGFSSNLVFSVEGGYELVLLPTALVVINASDGSYLGALRSSQPLNLLDGTVHDGVAFGVVWVGPDLFLQGFDLATGSLAVNDSLGNVDAPTCQPFEVTYVEDALFTSTNCGHSWSVYTPQGAYLWGTGVGGTVQTLRPIPIGPNKVLVFGPLLLQSPPGSPPSGDFSFEGSYAIYNVTTGAVIWEESAWFQVESDLVLMHSPISLSRPPAPAIEAWHSDYVVEWWDGATSLAEI